MYNPGPADPALSESIWRLETRFRENLNTDKNADADLNRELVTLTSLLSSGKLGKADDLMARYYRAYTLQAMNNLREQRGEKVEGERVGRGGVLWPNSPLGNLDGLQPTDSWTAATSSK